MDSLEPYRKKRDFARTPEPAGGGTPGGTALRYVIQKHWASRLHYDLRLELDGAMKSWAVPKGPSLDPADKRMAVQVEDHPIAYNRFEGQIPPGQYGAGKVIVWDSGYWVPLGDAAQSYREGKLKFELQGHKLKGRWTLVRMRGRDDEKQSPWLLIKEHDLFERPSATFSVVDQMPDSVASLPAVRRPRPARAARRAEPVQTPVRNRRARPDALPLPAILPPQLATLVDGPPAHPSDWIWELKFDGYRMAARIQGRQVKLLTRNGHDWTDKMPDLVQAIRQLPLKSGWLDGEVLMLDDQGVPDFQALQNAFDGDATQHLVYCVFDLPYADGQDLRGLSVVERRQRLQAVMQHAPRHRLRFSEAFEAPPRDLLIAARELGFEGLIGKRKTAAYVSRRNADWIKLKFSHRQEFVIGGFTDPQGSRIGIGALLLGVHAQDASLRYAGKVGTGFDERTLVALRKKLKALKTDKSPFGRTGTIAGKVHWVKPRLLAEISFAGWTQDNRIRHAVFHGLRSDKPARAIVREHARHSAELDAAPGKTPMTLLPKSLRISNPERVIDATTGITKIELVRYYAKVGSLMMSHLKGRPVSWLRAPAGIAGQMFFQKHLEKADMAGIRQMDPALDTDHPPLIEVVNEQGLLSAAQMNVVEFHTWNARKDRIQRPDRMTFDLDPGEGVKWEQVQEAAQLVRAMLHELGLTAFLKTSGGKGLHLVVPIKRLHGWETVKGCSQAVVQHLAKTVPQRFVARSGPRNRVGKVFVDYLRNGWGATTVSAWSARARPAMGVSVPVAWSELEALSGGAQWTIRSIDERLRQGNAPWAGYDRATASLSAAMKRLGFTGEAAR